MPHSAKMMWNIGLTQNRRMKESTRSLIKIIIAVVVIGTLAAFAWHYIKERLYGTYSSYEVISEMKLSSDVKCHNDANILAMSSINGARAINGTGSLIWEAAFSLDNPEVVSCGEVSAIADINGTSVYVIPESGIYTSYTTNYPISRIAVAKQGVTAVLMDSGNTDIVQVYDISGSLRVELATSTKQDGFPVDIALSDDGTKLVTLCISFDKDELVSKVTFYNMASVGKNFIDNIVGQKKYTGRLVYDVEFLGNDTVGITLEDGFVLYGMEEIPEALCDIKPEGTIVDLSMFDEGVCTVTEKDSERILTFYGTDGKKQGTIKKVPEYDVLQAANGEAALISPGKVHIYRKNGTLKYSGTFDGTLDTVYFGGDNRYFLVDSGRIRTIKLAKSKRNTEVSE